MDKQLYEVFRFIDIGMQSERVYDIDLQAGVCGYLHVL